MILLRARLLSPAARTVDGRAERSSAERKERGSQTDRKTAPAAEKSKQKKDVRMERKFIPSAAAEKRSGIRLGGRCTFHHSPLRSSARHIRSFSKTGYSSAPPFSRRIRRSLNARVLGRSCRTFYFPYRCPPIFPAVHGRKGSRRKARKNPLAVSYLYA